MSHFREFFAVALAWLCFLQSARGAADEPAPATAASAAPAASTPAASTPAASTLAASSPTASTLAAPLPVVTHEKPWFEKIKIRGYAQIRFNRLPTLDSNEELVNDQGDRYIGDGSGLGIRRARLIVFGDVHPSVSIYLQTDFASVVGEQLHAPTMRDWYADIFLDHKKEFRLRVGQSKVPYGFENMQSSQNRLPLDRNDAINSAVKDERDLGVFAYYAPAEVRKLFKELVDDNLKGSGDYGVVALGFYNGQTANKLDKNDDFHVVGRLTYPFVIGSQVLEVGAGAYLGRFRVSLKEQEDGTTYRTTDEDNDLLDTRAIASVVLYPKPFGFQAEYNLGRGPEQGVEDPTVIDSRALHGGYAQVMLKIDEPLGTVSLIPYVRGTLYQGGKKFESNAPGYDVRELEAGAEWQIWKALELTLAYAISDRTSSRYPYTQEQGHIGRVQLQFNY